MCSCNWDSSWSAIFDEQCKATCSWMIMVQREAPWRKGSWSGRHWLENMLIYAMNYVLRCVIICYYMLLYVHSYHIISHLMIHMNIIWTCLYHLISAKALYQDSLAAVHWPCQCIGHWLGWVNVSKWAGDSGGINGQEISARSPFSGKRFKRPRERSFVDPDLFEGDDCSCEHSKPYRFRNSILSFIELHRAKRSAAAGIFTTKPAVEWCAAEDISSFPCRCSWIHDMPVLRPLIGAQEWLLCRTRQSCVSSLTHH